MKKHIAPLIWIVAGVLFCIFFARMNEGVDISTTGQLLLFYGGCLTTLAGFVTRTLLYRYDNCSQTNFLYKIMVEFIFLLAILAAMIRALCF